MPINHSHKLAFVHIPKTAGSSIEQALDMYGYANSGENSIFDPGRLFGHEYQLSTAFEIHNYLLRRQCDPESFTWFAVVRHPFYRFLSEYMWRRKWDPRLQCMTVLDFLLRIVVPGSQHIDNFLYRHFIPQVEFIRSSPNLAVSPHVYRLEDTLVPLENSLRSKGISVSFPRINSTTSRTLAQQLDQTLKKDIEIILQDIYSEDYARLKYEPLF